MSGSATHREKRVEQHRQNEARVTSEIRNLEKKLLELIAARSVRFSFPQPLYAHVT